MSNTIIVLALMVLWYGTSTGHVAKRDHVDELLSRYRRTPYTPDFYYDDEPPLDACVSCTTECGGVERLIVDGCNSDEHQVDCYTGFFNSKICCVSTECHSAMGVCRQSPLDMHEAELTGVSCNRDGYQCYGKSCAYCGGVCTTSAACTGGFRDYPGRSCRCAAGGVCCLDPDQDPGYNSCELNEHCKGRCIGDTVNCNSATEKECIDEPCVCPNTDKCCVKDCNPTGVDMCAAAFPGHGQCRPQCIPGLEIPYHEPGYCENGCECCKRLADCVTKCRGECLDANALPSPGYRNKLYCSCPDPNLSCFLPPRPGDTTGHGDPKYTTFDDMHFDFHGTCSYVLFQECVERPIFRVIAKHAAAEDTIGHHRAYIIAIRLFVYHTVIDLTTADVKVNGTSVLASLPMTVEGNVKVYVDTEHKRVHVDFPEIFTVAWNGNGNVKVDIEHDWQGAVCGMLGNADGDPSNDMNMLMPNGELRLTEDANEFGYSWEVPGSCEDSYDF